MDKAITFVKEAYAELGKSAWLTKNQAIQSTILVFIVVILLAIYVTTADLILSRILTAIIGGR